MNKAAVEWTIMPKRPKDDLPSSLPQYHQAAQPIQKLKQGELSG
jgi:hypothetical protein